MAKILSPNYSYAYNSSSELVNVSTAQRNEKYFCPICGELMTPHMGEIRRWHFVHKNAENCSYESYLHKLAKIKIRQAFLSSEHFMLAYNARAVCRVECPYVSSHKCESDKPVEFDLRKFYDTCEIEACYHQYKADLLLTSSIHPNFPPVLIEIMVTHKCTEEKIKEGVRIIEISIQSEEQIDNIINSHRFMAVRSNRYLGKGAITLYNFNKVETFDPTGSFDEFEGYFSRKNTIVLWLNREGRFGTFDCHCYEVSHKLPFNVHYYVTEIATPFKEIFQGFSKRGVKVRNCFLCKFSKQDFGMDRICVLYKKHNLPRKPSPYYAVSCPHYREDFGYQQDMIDVEQSLSVEQPDFLIHKFSYHICKEIL